MTVTVAPIAVSMIVAAAEKLVAPERVIVLDVTGVPSISIVRVPGVIPCKVASGIAEILPPRK